MTKKDSSGKVQAIKTRVTFDLDIPIVSLDGEPYKDLVLGGADTEMTSGSCVIGLLCLPDGKASGKERVRRGRLAADLYQANGQIELLRDDLEMIQGLLDEKMTLPIVALHMHEILKKAMEE